MFATFRRRQKLTVLNLYRVVDIDVARAIDGLAIIETALAALGPTEVVAPEKYRANYTKEWRSWSAFVSGVGRLPELTYADVSFATDEYALLYTNSLVNFTEPPELGSIHLGVTMPESEGSFERMVSLAKSVCLQSPFDYGYIDALSKNVEPFSEGKIMKTLLGRSSVRIDRRDTTWTYHLAGIRSGFLRSLYPANLINESHLANPSIDKLLRRQMGGVSPFDSNLRIWKLSAPDLSTALAVLAESGSLIWHEDGVDNFLARPEAKALRSRMSQAGAGALNDRGS